MFTLHRIIRILSLLLMTLLFASLSPNPKQQLFNQWPADAYQMANSAQNIKYLSESEQELILFCNLARIDGQLFASTFVKHYVTDTTTPQYASLVKRLNIQPGLPILEPTLGLTRSAFTHAKDMAYHKTTGINHSNGRPFYDCIHMFMPGSKTYGRNQHLGSDEPLLIILGLLCSAQDSLYSDRENILGPEVDRIGVTIAPHPRFCHQAVLDFCKQPVYPPPGQMPAFDIDEELMNKCPHNKKRRNRPKSIPARRR